MEIIFFGDKSISLPKPVAARSLAIPLTPKQSDLFGVMDRSIKLVCFFEKYLVPIFLLKFSCFNSIIPSLSSDKFNSDSEHNIPCEVTPLISVTDNFILFFGIIELGGAYTVNNPSLAFGAPQTTFNIFPPISTSQTFNLSALGCFFALTIFAIKKLSKFPRLVSTLSTSRPILVNPSIN